MSPPEFVYRADAMPMAGGQTVKYINKQMRALIWADEEVRTVLLEDDNFDELAKTIGDPFNLLDLMTAMSLEAERHPA
jgi:hypothetical protein